MRLRSLFAVALVAVVASSALAQFPLGQGTRLPPKTRPALNVLRVASNVADGETVTIGSTVFEVDTAASPGAITAGRIRVDCSTGVTPTIFTAAFEAAVNGTNVLGFRYRAAKISNAEVLVVNGQPGADATACTETLAGANNAWAAATMYGGDSTDETQRSIAVISRAANATEAALLTMHFVVPFPPATATVQVRTSAGVLVAFDGTVAIAGNRVDVSSTGTATVASTNVVTVTAGN